VNPTPLPRGALLAVAAGLVLPLAACTSSGSSASSSASSSARSSTAAGTSSAPSSAAAAGPTTPVGAGCAQLPASGPGSLAAMAAAPVVTGASGNPQLTALVQAVTAASLVDTLNTTQNITVFAPANSAFQAVPADQLAAAMADTAKLTAILTHHVVPGRLTPDRVTGTLTTLDNDKLTVQGTGESLTISGDQTLSGQPAHLVCGNVQTANATVYIVDQVLKPLNAG
jgi:uncharacterized surface protein with fasciclin (FAS1) repeats